MPFTFHGGCSHIVQPSPIRGSTGIIVKSYGFHINFGSLIDLRTNIFDLISQLVENVAICLVRITERVSQSSEMLDELCKHGLIRQATHFMSLNSRTTLSQPIYNVGNSILSFSDLLPYFTALEDV